MGEDKLADSQECEVSLSAPYIQDQPKDDEVDPDEHGRLEKQPEIAQEVRRVASRNAIARTGVGVVAHLPDPVEVDGKRSGAPRRLECRFGN